MKLAFVLLACFVAVTLQQNVYWRSPAAAADLPYYYGITNYAYKSPAFRYPGFQHPAYRYPVYPANYEGYEAPYPYHEKRYPVKDETYPVFHPEGMDLIDEKNYLAAKQRLFGLNGGLLNIRRSTSTTYSTVVSTVSATTTVVCYTSTMFSATTACRRKRSIDDMISIGENNGDYSMQQWETLANLNDQLPREGRDIDPASLIESSRLDTVSDVFLHVNPSDAVVNQYMRKEKQLFNRGETTTSTVTSYALSYSTTTSTNTRLASTAGLTCVPASVTLC